MSNGWSVKKLVRTIVLTRAYQLGGDAPGDGTVVGHPHHEPALARHQGARMTAKPPLSLEQHHGIPA